VFPDSAYALEISGYTSNAVKASRPQIGLNPIGFCDPRIWPKKNAYIYSGYIDTLAAFSLWLLSHNYGLKVFSAEVSVDVYALEDLKRRLLSSLSPAEIDEIFAPPSGNVRALIAVMSACDFVVTSKFHGVVFSHLLAKPVVALSYHKKIDDLMRTVGHSQYCLNIESFDEKSLKTTFTTLVEDAQGLKAKFRHTTAFYSKALKVQFDELFLPQDLQLHPPGVETERSRAIVGGPA
jgi:polysaccharide pyruvyl transferase WcaK-like protein